MRQLTLPLLLLSMATLSQTAAAVEFADYDYSRWSQDMTTCDELAAHGRDPGHIGPPTTRAGMDKAAAIAACEAAVAADPENPRLNYQLGRAYGYSGRGDDAMPYRLKAVEQDYPQSLFVIGYLYLLGQTIEQDLCQARSLWLRGARYQRLAALIALPRHQMNGDFDHCGEPVPTEDLRAYLERAAELSSDYYVGLLVDELLEDLDGLTGSTQP